MLTTMASAFIHVIRHDKADWPTRRGLCPLLAALAANAAAAITHALLTS